MKLGDALSNSHGRRQLGRLAALVAAGILLILSPWSVLPLLVTPLAGIVLAVLFLTEQPRRGSQSPEMVPEPGFFPPNLLPSTVLDAISTPVVLMDHRGHVVQANSTARAIFAGLRLGHPLAFAVRAPAFLAAIDKVLSGAFEASTEISERVPVERRFDIAIRRLAEDGKEPQPGQPHAVVIMVETSDARRLDAMRADFIANASHELRTPLASIIGFIETLQGPARDDAVARQSFLTIMEAQARRMARLIDDLLSLSRIELSEHIRPSEPVSLDLLLRSVRDALRGLAQDRGVELHLTSPDSEAIISGDRDELVRVFENLIENAVKYGQSGGRVEIAVARTKEIGKPAFAVSVKDYGPGIAPEHLPRLTERFYRADVNESRVMGGTGLGLAIVKHIVTRHRGRLVIESRPGEGATFTVLLPASEKQEKS